MAENDRNPSASAGEADGADGAGSVFASVCEELGFANRIYALAVRMKEELGSVTGEAETDSGAAARLVRIEHEARQALRQAVETENRLVEQLGRMAQGAAPEPGSSPSEPADEEASPPEPASPEAAAGEAARPDKPADFSGEK